MEFDSLEAQGFLRSTIGCIMVGDQVQTERGSGVVENIHEDRSITVNISDGGYRCLQRDCRLLTAAPVIAPRIEVRPQRIYNALDWTGHKKVFCNGTLEQVVCATTVNLSPTATSIEIVRGSLRVKGQDQGWGDTAYAGVRLRLKYLHEGDEFDEFTAASITFDHNRNRAGQHNLDFDVGLGLKTARPIQVELFVHTPSFPGWSAHVSSVQLDIEVEEILTVIDSPEAWKDLHFSKHDAINILWRRCGSPVLQMKDDARIEGVSWLGHLEVDLSHLSHSGLECQGVVGKSSVKSLSEQGTDRKTVAERILIDLGRRSELSIEQKQKITKLSKVLESADKVSNGPSEANDRRAACDELLAMISFILEGLGKRDDMGEFVASSFAEAASHCWTAWEEAVHMAYQVICPDASAPVNVMTMEVEDWLLSELLTMRRDLAYRALAKAKADAGETDVHFKNFFFASIHFGLPVLHRIAMHDPSRLNYTMLNLVKMDKVREDLWSEYTPAAIVAHVRRLLSENAYWNGRVVDWLRAHCIQGLDPEKWLYEWCHTEDYHLLDEALVFMLASMRILKSDTLCEIRPATAPPRIVSHLLPPKRAQENNSHERSPQWQCAMM